MDAGKIIYNAGLATAHLRTARGWTQEELGERVGTSRYTIMRIENGRHTPTLYDFIKLCDGLGVTADEFLQTCTRKTFQIDGRKK